MALNRTVAASLLVLAATVVLAVACGSGDETLEERWTDLEVPEAEIVFLGDFTEAEQAAITREVKSVQVAFAERFDVVTSEFTLYISTDFDELNDVYRELRRRGDGLPEWFTCSGFAFRHVLFIALEDCDDDSRAHGGPIAHEYFHVLQAHLGWVGGSRETDWLLEGSAVYASAHYGEEHGRRTVSWWREAARLSWSGLGDWLSGPDPLFGLDYQTYLYDVGFLAIDWLVERKGEEALVEFFRLGGGRHEFEKAFDMTLSDFFWAIEEYRREVAPPFEWRRAGKVVDPDGRAVRGARVGAVVRLEDKWVEAAGDETNAYGEFEFHGPGRGHVLSVSLTCPGGNQVRGPWVFAGGWGEDGFVVDEDGEWDDDEEGAEPFSEESHRTDILIELPETRAALSERHCAP